MNIIAVDDEHLASKSAETLASVGLEDVVIKGYGNLAVGPDKIECDLYDYCNADGKSHAGVINQYVGEFMAQYSWAEFAS